MVALLFMPDKQQSKAEKIAAKKAQREEIKQEKKELKLWEASLKRWKEKGALINN